MKDCLMNGDGCTFKFLTICFEQAWIDPTVTNLFGFSEFLATVAIITIAYNIIDERYKFRVEVSRFSFHKLIFYITAVFGFYLLMLGVWFNENLPIPSFLNNYYYHQFVVALVILIAVIGWMYSAFIDTPNYSKYNADKYARAVYKRVAFGNDRAIIAASQEMLPAIGTIFDFAQKSEYVRDFEKGGFKSELTVEAKISQQLISIFGDRRFCFLVAKHVPALSAEVFSQASQTNIEQLPIDQFTSNVTSEFLKDTSTAIHFEGDGFHSGLVGFIRPVSRELFEHVDLIEGLSERTGSPFDEYRLDNGSWDATSWQTYIRVAKAFVSARLKKYKTPDPSMALNQICKCVQGMSMDAHLMSNMGDDYHRSLQFRKIELSMEFIAHTLEALEENGIFASKKTTATNLGQNNDLYDVLAEVAFQIIFNAANVRTADFKNWQIQHNVIWGELFSSRNRKSEIIFRYRLIRKLYKAIKEMDEFYNLKGARYLGFCLNVMGLLASNDDKNCRAFHLFVINWTKKNYSKMDDEVPKIAEFCLSGTVRFEAAKCRLVKTYGGGFGHKPVRRYLDLLPHTKLTSSSPTNGV